MSKILTIKIAGSAGMGIKSGGLLLSQILVNCGFNICDYTEYPSLVRGGHNTYQVSFSSQTIFSIHHTVDIFFSLPPGHHQHHQSEFTPQTLVIGENLKYHLPLAKLAQKLGNPIYANTICLGVACCLLTLDSTKALQVVQNRFGSDNANISAFKTGYDYALTNFSQSQIKLKNSSKLSKNKNTYIYDGSQAFSWGFIQAKGNFYAAYPMTPSTGALHTLAALQQDHHIKVIHPEDEIAAASLAAGAAFAGARSAVGTSGGGFALMNETLSFCGIAELGVVFYLVSRPGPATGMPTWTSQADLLYAIHAGHGGFPKIVLAPSDQQDSFDMAVQALNLADQLQTPVIVLSDKFIAESSTNLKNLSTTKVSIKRGKIITTPSKNFKRYSWNTKTGLSARTLPGTINGEFIANSYEHNQKGFSTEDPKIATKMRQKRAKKLKTALKLIPKPIFLTNPKAKKLIISWGSTKGTIIDALSQLKNNQSFALLHLRTLWPINPNLKLLLKPFEKIITIENNQSGQLTSLLKSQFDFNPDHQILKYDGRPFFPKDLVKKLNKL